MKVGPDIGSRPTNESHLNGGVPRLGLLPGPHDSPGLGTTALSPLLTKLYPYDCTMPPGFSGFVEPGLSFSPEKTQIELACNKAASFGLRLPGGPITSLAKAALALAPVRAAVQTATASNDFLCIAYLPYSGHTASPKVAGADLLDIDTMSSEGLLTVTSPT
jgi:hypothetical protein